MVGFGVERSFVCSWLVDFVAAMDGDEDGDGDDSGGGEKEREVIYWGSKHEKETWHNQMDKLWGGSRDGLLRYVIAGSSELAPVDDMLHARRHA